MNPAVVFIEPEQVAITVKSAKPIVKEKISACFLCAGYCGVVISLDEDDKVVKVVGDKRNPNSEGFICNKGVNLFTLLDSPNRLTQPLKRVNGELVAISWNQALDEIAEKLKAIRAEHGARALGFAFGGSESQTPDKILGTMMINGLGSFNTYSPAGLEFLGRYLVSEKMYGATVMEGHPDFDHAQYIIIIGGNPLVSCPPEGQALKAASKDPDRTLVVIDPRKTDTAKLADKYLGINISTDVYFLLAMANIIIAEQLYDVDFVRQSVNGLQVLSEAVKPFSAEIAEQHTGIKADDIYQVARGFANAGSGVLYYHMGVVANHHATLVTWLIQCIKVITNNKGRKGGSLINPLIIDLNKLYKLTARLHNYQSRTKPGLGHIGGSLPITILADEILTPGAGQIKAMIVSCCNPLKAYGDSKKMVQAFDELELLVSIDPFLTEVGRKADYILPNCAFQEQENICFPHPWMFTTEFVQLLHPIRPPRAESWPEWKIFREILKRTGPQGWANIIQHKILCALEWWHKVKGTPGGFNQQWGFLKTIVRIGGISWQEVLDKPHGFTPKRKTPYHYLDKLGTKDKKIQMGVTEFIRAVAELPMIPLPLDEQYPLTLSTICRSKANTNTLYKNRAWLQKNTRESNLRMHSSDAGKMHIEDGEIVRLVSATASDNVMIQLTEDVMPGSVHLTHGWGLQERALNADRNIIGIEAAQFSTQDQYDVFTGMPVLSGVPCRIEKVVTVP